MKYVHILVAETFLDNPLNKLEVNHKDENKKNNRVDNLEWCDRKYNNSYGTRDVRVAKKLGIKINQYDFENNFIKTWDSIRSALDVYKNTHIVDCLKGRRKTASGFVWKYKKGE